MILRQTQVTKERNYVSGGRKYVTIDRQRERSSKRVLGVKKAAVTRTVVREIVKKPISYGKSGLRDREEPVKKTAQNTATSKKVELAQKVVPVKKAEEKKPTEPTLDGHYELSPLLSKMLEAELQDVMTKIWELLPENPRDEAEKLVVDRFRNKAGNDLRNTLGLNVTKRLLNVHNTLYVKMIFSDRPASADLVSFIKKYNISAFKRVGLHGGIFAAKMRNFQDFDNLCSDKNLKCGTVRVTVTPCYQFMKCPPNLRTCYDGKEDTVNKNNEKTIALSKPVQAESREKTKPTEKNASIQQNLDNKQNDAQKATVTKPEAAAGRVATKVTPAKSNAQLTDKQVAEKDPAKTNPASTQSQNSALEATPAKEPTVTAPKVTTAKQQANIATQNSTSKVTPAKQAAVTAAQNTAPKVTPAKQAAVTADQNTAPKVAPVKQPVVAKAQNTAPKVTPAKQPAVTAAQNTAPKIAPVKQPPVTAAQNTAVKVTPAKQPAVTVAPNTAPKVTPAKQPAVTAAAQNTTPKVTPAKQPAVAAAQNTAPKVTPVKQPAVSGAQNTAPKVTPAKQPAAVKPQKAPNKAAHQQKVAPKPKQVSPTKKHEDDYDELDDHDILALISEGIVLDECSGSEEE